MEKSGIRPINPGIFTEEDYTPSYESSTQLHLPTTFTQANPAFSDSLSDTSDSTYEPPQETSSNSDHSESDDNSDHTSGRTKQGNFNIPQQYLSPQSGTWSLESSLVLEVGSLCFPSSLLSVPETDPSMTQILSATLNQCLPAMLTVTLTKYDTSGVTKDDCRMSPRG